jgi:hypothetical protein
MELLVLVLLQLLYDLVFEKAADPKSPACSKTHRDTHNRTLMSLERSTGQGPVTTNRLAFAAPTLHEKPEFARRPLIRDTFYRKVIRPPGPQTNTLLDLAAT